ncbi:hypothetical protein VN97_g8430 [Penicillium thymicola]|uniref:Zn(2)-C6 fungal-type domain-containing protein n=1 Tax=Penicillium thymicola TaxID=293382 RepID=A0AAI9TCS5_PENTH|nr:hypothetical protein VN97_g8430 [Penicillium thymicola]
MNATISTVKRRACVACTTAKAKCTPQAVNLCQRCARLGKSCTYLDLPQTKRKHKAAPSRVEVLEKKVDQLTSQLAALTRQNGPDTSNPLTNNLGSSRDPELDSTNIVALLEVAQDPSHGLNPPTSSILEGQPSIVDQGLLSETEAERLVTTFQTDLVSTFPFVLIADDETAAGLRDREPFLFLSIVAVTMGGAHPLRKIVAEEIMKHITLRVVARSERNLELLRGLLVYIAWYSYPAERYHPQLLLLVQLCVAILYDLGLHRKPSPNLDEQRALLENAIRTEIKYVEMRLEELSLRGELWIAEPASAVRTTMLVGVIQRSKELIHMVRNLPVSEIAHMTISTSARICAAVGYMPTAVLTLLNLITSPTDSSMEAQVQAVVDAAEYPKVVIELANALETKCEGMSAADKETDIVGSLCSKMRLLARCYPYQIRAIVGSAPPQDVSQDTSMIAVDTNEFAVTPQVWPDGSTYGDLGDVFPIDDIQWDSLLSDFTGFS